MTGVDSLALSVNDLSKTFAGVTVLSDVSLSIARGEVHALLGQNGSGKSTLIKCLAGVHRPDAGATMYVAGAPLPATYNPNDARRYGLAFVHQDLGLVDDMTVADNLALGTGFATVGPLLSPRRQRARTAAVLEDFGLAISPNAVIRDLPVTARTLLAIARAFHVTDDGGVPLACMILDEPTAALPDNDAELLFAAIRRVTAAGVGVGYVTHRLEEVTRIADRATVLRDGRRTATLDMAGTSQRDLVAAIVGDRTSIAVTGPPSPKAAAVARRGERVLEVKGLSGRRIKDASLSIHEGEIVGVAGLAGSGRSELARLIFGAQAVTAGTRRAADTSLVHASPRAAMRAGVGLVPEDRRRDGCVLTMSVAENLTLASLERGRTGLLNVRKERHRVAADIEAFDIRPRDPQRAIGTLSGGNQQKVVLAKWLAREPRVLVLDEPVQGVDVGAKADIFSLLRSAASRGTGVVVIDSDFDNLAGLCDRVLILRDGRIAEELSGTDLTTENMSRATFGVDDSSKFVASRPTNPQETS